MSKPIRQCHPTQFSPVHLVSFGLAVKNELRLVQDNHTLPALQCVLVFLPFLANSFLLKCTQSIYVIVWKSGLFTAHILSASDVSF